MCCVEWSVIIIQRLGKISSAEVSLRKELPENSSKLGQAVSLWSRRCSSFAPLSASFHHSLCWKAASKDFARLIYFPCSVTKTSVSFADSLHSSRRRRKLVGGFFLWLSQNKMHCLVYSLKTIVTLQLKHSHLAINGAPAKRVKLNTECNKNGNSTKMER